MVGLIDMLHCSLNAQKITPGECSRSDRPSFNHTRQKKKMTVWKLTQEDKLGKEIKIAWVFINRLYNINQADSPNFQ
jgi:hypothetical protein